MNGMLGPIYFQPTADEYGRRYRGKVWCDYTQGPNAWGVHPYYVTKNYSKPPTENAVLVSNYEIKMD